MSGTGCLWAASALSSQDSNNLVEVEVPASSSRCWFWHWLFRGDSESQDLIISGLWSKSKYFVNCQTGNWKKWVWTVQEIYLGVLFQLSMPLNDTKGVLWAVNESEVLSWAIYCLLIIADKKQCDGVDKEETQVPWPVFCTWLYQEHRCWTSYMALLFPSSSLPTSWVSYLKQLLHLLGCLCSTD